MLYPNFNDLIAFKDRKSDLVHPSRRSVNSIVSGNHHSPFKGQGLKFDAVREYVPGDDIRRIDWRVTARTGSPHLKVFKEDRERYINICVDVNAEMRFGTKNTFKSVQAARIAALLGWQGIASQDRVSAFLFGDVPNGVKFFEPKRTQKSLGAMLKMLSEPPLEQHQVSLEIVLQQIDQTAHAGSLVYLISDFMSIAQNLKQDHNLNHLSRRCDVVLVAINDQADKSIFPIAGVGFCGSEKEKIYINTESSRGKQAYALQWYENRKLLKEICTRFKFPLIELTTESDIYRDLTLELKGIAKWKKR